MTNVRTDVRELRIRDRVPGTDRLVPFAMLLHRVHSVEPSLFRRAWMVESGAYGRGKGVTSIEDALEETDRLETDLESILVALIHSDDEEFYNAEFRQVDGTVSLGIFDSTFLFIRGPRALVDEVARSFSDVEFVGA